MRAETGWNFAPANRGACSASNAWSASSTCRQPRYWSTLDSANTTVSTLSPTVARKFSSPVVNGADASTTNSSAVADAAASWASSPCTESRPPTPGVSTRDTFSRNSDGPSISTYRGGSCPVGSSWAADTQLISSVSSTGTGASWPG